MEISHKLRRHPVALYFAAGALLGAIFFLLINTAAPLNVTWDGWIKNGYVEKDIIQHYTGWLFYRDSPIRFPLGIAESVNYPDGLAVTFTDSIPLFAIFFRLFEGILPETFQYFGLYTLLCYMLSGSAAALLLSLFSDRVPAVLLGSCVMIASPIMIERAFRHTALGSHFLILFALYLYFKNKQTGFRYRKGYYLLAALATAIHPYFLPMVFAILFADLIEEAVRNRHLVKPLLFLLGAIGIVAATAYSIGIFSSSASADIFGYGYFCMNLNSLFNPVSCQGILWSRVLPALPQGLGSYDGFNYLGLGVLVAFPIVCLLWFAEGGFSRLFAFLKRYWGMLLVCCCLTAFAVSTTVLANSRVLFSFTLPAPLLALCSTFRSSGRMFYPIYYLIYLFVLVFLLRKGGRYLASVLVALLLAVQLWDISPALKTKHTYFTDLPIAYENPMKNSFWQENGGQYAHMFSLDNGLIQSLYPALYCAENHMTTNDLFTARFDEAAHTQQVEEEIMKLEQGILAPDTIYITSDRALFFRLAGKLEKVADCAQIDTIWYIFVARDSSAAPLASYPELTVYPNFPLMLEDYTDPLWTRGVLNSDPTICAVLNNSFTDTFLKNAEYLIADGKEYRILNKDYSDPGWLMLKLDLSDASVLVDKELSTK